MLEMNFKNARLPSFPVIQLTQVLPANKIITTWVFINSDKHLRHFNWISSKERTIKGVII